MKVILDNPIKDSLGKKNIDHKKTSQLDFKELLSDSIKKVNDYQVEASEMDQKLLLGKIDNIHDVTIAAQKAELSLSLAIEIRNKITEAYKEIMRMQV